MKTLAILFTILLLGFVYSASETSQGKLSAKNTREQFQQSHLGKAIIGMLEMNEKLGADMNGLFKALATLKESLLTKTEDENISFEADQDTHNSEVIRLQGLIDEYSGQITVYTQDLQNLSDTGVQLAEDLDGYTTQLNKARDAKTAEEDVIQKLNDDYNESLEDYDNAIAVIEQAQGKLVEAQAHALNRDSDEEIQLSEQEGDMSLAQTNSQDIENLVALLEKHVSKIHSSFFMKPIAQVFAMLSSNSQEIDTESLTRANKALEDLKDYLEQGKDQLNRDYAAESDQHGQVLSSLKNQIETLSGSVIPKAKQDIENNGSAQEAKQNEIDDATSNLAYESKNLVDENKSWDQREEIHDLLIPEFEAEYKIVVQAENVLKTQYGATINSADQEDY